MSTPKGRQSLEFLLKIFDMRFGTLVESQALGSNEWRLFYPNVYAGRLPHKLINLCNINSVKWLNEWEYKTKFHHSEVKNFVLRLLRLESIIIFVFTSIHPLTLKIKSVGHQKIFCEWKIKTNLTVTITQRPSIHNSKIQAKYKFKNFNYLNNNIKDETTTTWY